MKYLKLIPSAPAGVSITTSGSCSTTPVASYSCTITITANGAVSGTAIKLLMNGSLGTESFYTVTFQ